jgi:hypothetical protein
MTWVLLIWSTIFLVWAIAGAGSADCGSEATELDRSACEAGTGLGVAVIFVFWFVGFVALSLIWLMTRPKGRDCPVCGEKVKKGRTKCESCGYDFAAAASVSVEPHGASP